MRQLIKFTLFVSIFFISQAYALCSKTSNETRDVYFNKGTVVVNPNLKVGDVIAEIVTSFSNITSAFHCQYKNDPLDAEVFMTHLSPTSIGTNVYQTNIPGIGIQFKRTSIYPYTYPAPRDNGNINLSEGTMTATLYKTAEYVGSGPITAGQYTRYGVQSDPNGSALNSHIATNGIIIVAPSCSVISEPTLYGLSNCSGFFELSNTCMPTP